MSSDLLRDGAAYVDQWIAHQRALRAIPGIVVAIQHDTDMLLCRGFGFADLERQTPMTPRHVFRVASHSKMFTATAIMQLVEAGRVRLDDKLSAYVPWVAADFTLRQVMNHVSGMVRDGFDADFWQLQRPFPDASQLRQLVENSDAMILAPNEHFKYSNVGYSLLGLVVEAVSGQAYNAYVAQRIVEPLGLHNTGPETTAAIRDRLASAYVAHRPPLPRARIEDLPTNAMSPATGFYSTAEDLCCFARAHYFGNEELLSDASKREMQHAYWEVDQAEASYGLGLAVQTIGKRTMVGHGGGFPGHSTTTLIDPVDRLVVTVMINTHGPRGLAGPLAISIVNILDYALQSSADAKLEYPRETFVGRFMSAWGVSDIVSFGKRLVELSPDDDEPTRNVTDLEVVDADTLRIGKTNGYGSRGEAVRYERDAAGATTRIRHGGYTLYPAAVFEQQLREMGNVIPMPE